MRDNIFTKNDDLVDFVFDKKVADVFDDMVKRSVPGYKSMIEMIVIIAQVYGQNNTNYYDLGASTGAVSLALGLNNKHQNNHIIAVDNAAKMVSKCQKNLENKITNFEVICNNIENINIKNASIIVLNLTLQFIQSNKRQKLIDKIYQSLNPKGVLIITDKIHFNNKQKQKNLTNLHLNFKRANGYSELEIAKKRLAIENILITDSKKTHLKRLKKAGFKQATCHFQCINFASFFAIKGTSKNPNNF